MTYLLTFFSSFLGCMSAVLLWTTYMNIKRTKIIRELQKELLGKIETEMTFQKLTQQIRQDWETEGGYGVDY